MVFNEALGAGGEEVYWFNPSLTGNLSVVQNGTGITVLQPGAANTYTGSTTVNAGTLRLGPGEGASALPVAGP